MHLLLTLVLSSVPVAGTPETPRGAVDVPTQMLELQETKSRPMPSDPIAFNCLSLPAGLGGLVGIVLGAGVFGCGGCFIGTRYTGTSEAGIFAALIGSAVGAATFGLAGALGGAVMADSKASPEIAPGQEPKDGGLPPKLKTKRIVQRAQNVKMAF